MLLAMSKQQLLYSQTTKYHQMSLTGFDMSQSYSTTINLSRFPIAPYSNFQSLSPNSLESCANVTNFTRRANSYYFVSAVIKKDFYAVCQKWSFEKG